MKVDRERLESLDDLRYSDPQRAAELALEAASAAPTSLVPLCIGVYGSALRALGRLDEARRAIAAGLRRAYRRRDWWSCGNLVARLGYLEGDEGDWRRALESAARAGCFYLYADDQDGVGRTLVDRGRALYYLNRFEESLASARRALDLLAADSHRSRYSALVGAGLTVAEMGRLAEAQDFYRQAAEPARKVGPALQAKQLGLVAEIAELRGDYRLGEESFLRSAELYFQLSPVDSALASVRAVDMVIAQGDLGRAQELVVTLAKYLEACRRTKPVAAAILSLIKARDSLDRKMIQRVTRALAEHAAVTRH